VQLAISSAPSFILGMVASTTEVGQYALAWRIVLVLNLLVSAMGAIASPQFARASAIGDRDGLRRTAVQSVGLTFGLSFLPTLLLAINPAFFLSRFGTAYLPAAPALRILLIGQGAMILCATVPEMLGMTGHARSLMKINISSLITLLVGLGLLTPKFGDVGAAGATALTMLLNAIGVTLAARRDLGLVPLLAFYEDARLRLRQALQPATASDSPSLSGIQVSPSSIEASSELN
jgi:O-antigen/teichoic acid export membrane protein